MRHFNNIYSKLKKKYTVICEVGVHAGDNAREMADHLKAVEIHLVDNYLVEDNLIPIAVSKLRQFPSIWYFMDSVEAARLLNDEYFDVVYIDASHDYESVKQDIHVWYPKVKKGGYLAGHDWSTDTVRVAVKEFADKHENIDLQYDDDEFGHHEDWYFKKI